MRKERKDKDKQRDYNIGNHHERKREVAVDGKVEWISEECRAKSQHLGEENWMVKDPMKAIILKGNEVNGCQY